MILTPLQKCKKDLHDAVVGANVTEWFERYINKSRGMGCTDLLIYGCKMRGGTLITLTEDTAEQIRDSHNIKAVRAGDGSFAISPTRSCVDNAAIMMLVKENRKVCNLADQLLAIMKQKMID